MAGSIIRGSADQASDLDVYVVQKEPFRQRLQRKIHDVPVEIFINPPAAIKGYFESEQAARKPITAHMFVTGFVILNLDPVIGELQAEAQTYLANPPAAPMNLTYQRYLAALLYEDAVDVAEKDPLTANMIVNRAVWDMLNFHFIQAGQFIPRQKSLLTELAQTNGQLAALARNFYSEADIHKKMEIAGQIADQTVGARCFFEWDSSPEKIAA